VEVVEILKACVAMQKPPVDDAQRVGPVAGSRGAQRTGGSHVRALEGLPPSEPPAAEMAARGRELPCGSSGARQGMACAGPWHSQQARGRELERQPSGVRRRAPRRWAREQGATQPAGYWAGARNDVTRHPPRGPLDGDGWSGRHPNEVCVSVDQTGPRDVRGPFSTREYRISRYTGERPLTQATLVGHA
jgi:hypothetical protein